MAKYVEPLSVGCYNRGVPPQVYGKGLDAYETVCLLEGKMNEVIEAINDEMYSFLDKYFNQIMIDAAYDSTTETLILQKEIVSDSNMHTYNADERSITIG